MVWLKSMFLLVVLLFSRPSLAVEYHGIEFTPEQLNNLKALAGAYANAFDPRMKNAMWQTHIANCNAIADEMVKAGKPRPNIIDGTTGGLEVHQAPASQDAPGEYVYVNKDGLLDIGTAREALDGSASNIEYKAPPIQADGRGLIHIPLPPPPRTAEDLMP